jgi:hypothetical protein
VEYGYLIPRKFIPTFPDITIPYREKVFEAAGFSSLVERWWIG